MMKTKIFTAIILIGLLLNLQIFTKNVIAVDPTPTLTTTPTITTTTTPTITPTSTPILIATPTISATTTSTSSSLPVAGGLTPTLLLLLMASSFIGFSFFSLNKK